MHITILWNYRFIIRAFLCTLMALSLEAETTSHFNDLTTKTLSKVGYYKSCLLGEKTRNPQEIWKIRRNVGIASALFITSIGIRKLYMTYELMPDITQVMREFEYDYSQHKELPSLEEFIEQNKLNDTVANHTPEKDTVSEKKEDIALPTPPEKLTSKQGKSAETSTAQMADNKTETEKEVVDKIGENPENKETKEEIKESYEEKAFIIISSSELTPAIKKDIMEKLSALNNALMAYIENPDKQQRKNLGEAYKDCIAIINTYKEHKEPILSSRITNCKITAKMLINHAKEIFNNPEAIQQIQKMQQFEKQCKQLAQNITMEQKKEIKDALIPLEKELTKKIAIYEQNKSEENLLELGMQLMALQQITLPIPLEEITSLDGEIILDIQAQLHNLFIEKPNLLNQCIPNSNFLENMELPMPEEMQL